MKLKSQIVLLLVVMSVFMLIIGINGIYSLSDVSNSYSLTLTNINGRNVLSNKMVAAINGTKAGLFHLALLAQNTTNKAELDEPYDEFNEQLDMFYDRIDMYQENINNDRTLPDTTRTTLQEYHDNALADVDALADIGDSLYDAALSGDKAKVREVSEGAASLFLQLREDINLMVDIAEKRMDEAVVKNRSESEISVIVSIVILVIAIILGVIFSSFIAAAISVPLNKLADAAENVAHGNFDVDTRSNMTNEIGRIANSFTLVVDTLRSLFGDMNQSFANMSGGDLDARVHAGNYDGTYRKVAEMINSALDDTASDYVVTTEAVEQYANGNFSYRVSPLPGKKALLSDALDKMRIQFESIIATSDAFIAEVERGNLNVSADIDKFSGDWQKIAVGFEEFANIVAQTAGATMTALDEISKGNFSYRADVSKHQGSFKLMLERINSTCDFISDYVSEISQTLTRMANQDLNVSIDRDYLGDFAQIKTSLDLIINNFNKLIEEIMLSSEQVAIGSSSIADSSTSLAQGASEQASAVEQLTATIGTIAETTSKNIELVLESSDLAEKAQGSVDKVRSEMGDLLESMKEINESSNNISAVLQVIDDIAFQTNILALNAAVEAARAGEHGKGFAIVAEEVRNLAARSQEAAKNSSDLIQVSVAKAEQGSLIADRTAETISAVTEQIERISKISTDVADIYKEQNKSIGEINIGIKQVSEVVANNTATSEESAAASQELASQSAVFKEMVNKFKLKNRRRR